jgi:hypothetical protein
MTDPFSAGAPGDLEELVRSAYQSAARTVRPEHLRRTSPMFTAGSVPRPRRIKMLVPFAAAAAVIAVVGASVALPRLLTGSSGSGSGSPGISTYAPGQHPPFQVVLTANSNNSESALRVESAATGRVLVTLAPRHGQSWQAVSATADATKFVVAEAPSSAPYRPTTLYTLTLLGHGRGVRLDPLATLPVEISSMAASADGSTVAYTTFSGGSAVVGVLRGGKTRERTVSNDKTLWVSGISVSYNGDMIAFLTDGRSQHGPERAAWVMSAGSATIAAAAPRKIRDYTWTGGQGHATTIPESALISPDGSELYIATAATAASGKSVARVTSYSTADGASLGTISTWDNGYLTDLIPVGGLPLVWNVISFLPYNKGDFTAYLLNPAARTRTTVRLHGIPLAQNLKLAW